MINNFARLLFCDKCGNMVLARNFDDLYMTLACNVCMFSNLYARGNENGITKKKRSLYNFPVFAMPSTNQTGWINIY